MISRESVSAALKNTQKMLDYAENQLSASPLGTLKVHKIKNNRYYSILCPDSLSEKSIERYLKINELEKYAGLALKRYYKKIIPVLKQRIAILKKFESEYKNYLDEALNALPSGIADLCSPLCVLPNGRVCLWDNYRPQSNPHHPEKCIYEAKSGDMVRSKSELMIANLLYDAGILFRYEAALTINGRTIYPDFTILSPLDGTLIFWDHFGMMDDPEYCNSFINRKRIYNAAGFLEGFSLIFTFESALEPLTPKDVKLQIDRLLCC